MNRPKINEEDSIDIILIIKKIWDKRRLILKISTVFFIAGCIFSLISPIEYTSHTTFVPRVSEDQMSKGTSSIGSLASLAGISLVSDLSTSDNYLSPLLYTKISDSEEFSLKILNEDLIKLSGEKITIRNYYLSKKVSLLSNINEFIYKYTIGLFSKNNNKIISDKIAEEYNFISDEDFKMINFFKEKFWIDINEKEGYIKVSAIDNDAFISSQLVKIITKNLQTNIINLRINKIRERLNYSKDQYEIKQKEFDELQKELAEFKDSNKNISTNLFNAKLQKLEDEYQLQKNILINLASEYNNNKIKLNKDTPIFSVVDEVSVPNNRSKPKRSIIVLAFLCLGFILSVSIILIKKPLTGIINKIIN